MVFAANSPFDENLQSYKFIHHFNPVTNDTSHFLKAISENIHLLFNPSISYNKVGVAILNLRSEAHQQWDLFPPSKEKAPLMNVLDNINRRYDTDRAFFIAQGIDEKCAMRRCLLTPKYTTNLKHVPTISC